MFSYLFKIQMILKMVSLLLFAWLMTSCQSASVFDTAPGYKTQIIASGLSGSRSLVFDSNKGLLTIARTLQKIILIKESSFFSNSFDQVVLLDLSNAGLNLTHGLAYRDGYIYASSDVNIWRWAYTPGSRNALNPDSRQWVVRNMVLLEYTEFNMAGIWRKRRSTIGTYHA